MATASKEDCKKTCLCWYRYQNTFWLASSAMDSSFFDVFSFFLQDNTSSRNSPTSYTVVCIFGAALPPPPLATSAGAATFQSLSSFKRLDTKFIGYLLWISNMVKLAGCISARIDPNKKRKTPTHLRRLAFQNRSCIGSIRLQRIQQNNHPPTGPQHPSPSSVALSGWTSTASKHSLGIGPLWSSLTLH